VGKTFTENEYDLLQSKYLEVLSKMYPSIASASTEIINLQAILNLPKGTEHVLSDIHGEAAQFFHVLKNGSGAVRAKIDDEFGNSLCLRDKKQLAALIYYPSEKLDLIEKEEPELDDWYKITLHRLIQVCKRVASKYTRSKVRKALPKDFAYVIEELINKKDEGTNKEAYYNGIIDTIIRIGRSRAFIIALCELIQRLVIDHLHIVGDIYDRGSGAVEIMDHLMNYHSVDIQWGNHDLLWMGAASGQEACIANVIRICARYGNLETLEDDYGINLMPLANFALEAYADDECEQFHVQCQGDTDALSRIEEQTEMKMHKAISIIQFKLEGQLIRRRPDFKMENRLLLDKINPELGTVELDGTTYNLLDTHFPTIMWSDPYQLSKEEEKVMTRLVQNFKNCEKLQQHVQFLLKSGSLYLCYNKNLYYHGCVPLNEDGSFREVYFQGKGYSGKALYDFIESNVRKGYYLPDSDGEKKKYCQEMMWFAWSSENSPVFGKEKMATFERYFLGEPESHEERKDPYYRLIEDDNMSEKVCDDIIREFGLDPESAHIVNGHMPVKLKKGESPVKGNGKLFIIDGGFSKAYQKTTGIAGYTLVYNSYGLKLVTHLPFENPEKAIVEETDICENISIIEKLTNRQYVADTDNGKVLQRKIDDLELLLKAYRNGKLRENAE
jgi:fructose-1,6-bisphosphatase-3